MRSSDTPGLGADHCCFALFSVPVSKINVAPMTPLQGVPVHSRRTPSSTRNPATAGSDSAYCASESHPAVTDATSRAAHATRDQLAISAIGQSRVFLGLVAAGDLLPRVRGEEDGVTL